MKNTELKNITALDEIAAIISGNDSPKAIINRLDDYHGSDIAEVIRTELRLIASFDDGEIGSRMTANCMIIGEDMSVKQAMTALVSQARKNDNISTLFMDDENKLLGVITAQNIIEASDDEMGEDYAKLGGLSAEENLNEPVLASVKKRLPWLLILLGLAWWCRAQSLAVTIHAAVVAYYGTSWLFLLNVLHLS